jgi:hypothetical protein
VRNQIKLIPIILGFILFGSNVFAQKSAKEKLPQKGYIQFSGTVVSEDENGEILPLPYVNIGIVGTSRGTYSEYDGFFSMVATKGDTIKFSRIGFKDATIVVPDTLNAVYYSWIQIMTSDSLLLPEAVIYPWPDREFYKIEFLAMDVSDELRSRAEKNIAREVLAEIAKSLPVDGGEAYAYEYKKRINEYKYSGQYKPQNIFNPVAWANFVKAWKRGDFKNKDK